MAKAQSVTLPAWEVPPALIKHTKPLWGFYVTYGQRFMFQHFAALYAARAFIDLMLQGDDYTRKDDFTIVSTRGVSIRIENPTGRKGPSLFNSVLDYELSPQEQTFEFPERLLQMYRPFPNSPLLSHKSLETITGIENDETRDTPSEKPVKAAQRAPRASQPRVKAPSDTVPIADIASSLKIDAKQARNALRKANVPKPEHGWSFPPSEVTRITNLIKDNLK